MKDIAELLYILFLLETVLSLISVFCLGEERQLYYVHYVQMDRRLDEWIDKTRIVEEIDDASVISSVDAFTSGKTLTRSQRRFHEEFHHVQKSYDDMDATTAKLEREHEEV